jgi:hypothetical protein
VVHRLADRCGPDAIEYYVPEKGFWKVLTVRVVVVRLATETNPYRTRNIPHDDIGEGKILNACSSCADLDGTAIGIIDQAIGNGDVLRFTTTKPEYRPTRAETAVGDGYKLITAE